MQNTKGSWHKFLIRPWVKKEKISLGIAGVMGDDPILGSAVTQTGRPQAQRSMQNTFEDTVRLAK